jgi:hypothetical protein
MELYRVPMIGQYLGFIHVNGPTTSGHVPVIEKRNVVVDVEGKDFKDAVKRAIMDSKCVENIIPKNSIPGTYHIYERAVEYTPKELIDLLQSHIDNVEPPVDMEFVDMSLEYDTMNPVY